MALSAHIGPYWSVANIERNLEAGLITSKILCLVVSLLGYRSGLHAHFLFRLVQNRPIHIRLEPDPLNLINTGPWRKYGASYLWNG